MSAASALKLSPFATVYEAASTFGLGGLADWAHKYKGTGGPLITLLPFLLQSSLGLGAEDEGIRLPGGGLAHAQPLGADTQ